jgi:hypothetical protein
MNPYFASYPGLGFPGPAKGSKTNMKYILLGVAGLIVVIAIGVAAYFLYQASKKKDPVTTSPPLCTILKNPKWGLTSSKKQGDSVTAACSLLGAGQTGNRTGMCQADGTIKETQSCPDTGTGNGNGTGVNTCPPQPDDFIFDTGSGTSTYERACSAPYVGWVKATCSPTGWTFKEKCKKVCTPLGGWTKEEGSASPAGQAYEGERLSKDCAITTAIGQKAWAECTSDGTNSAGIIKETTHTCPVTCPAKPESGLISAAGNTTVYGTCPEGRTGTLKAVCNSSGVFDEDLSGCLEKQCPLKELASKGTLPATNVPPTGTAKTLVQGRCPEGKTGVIQGYCGSDQQWTEVQDGCQAKCLPANNAFWFNASTTELSPGDTILSSARCPEGTTGLMKGKCEATGIISALPNDPGTTCEAKTCPLTVGTYVLPDSPARSYRIDGTCPEDSKGTVSGLCTTTGWADVQNRCKTLRELYTKAAQRKAWATTAYNALDSGIMTARSRNTTCLNKCTNPYAGDCGCSTSYQNMLLGGEASYFATETDVSKTTKYFQPLAPGPSTCESGCDNTANSRFYYQGIPINADELAECKTDCKVQYPTTLSTILEGDITTSLAAAKKNKEDYELITARAEADLKTYNDSHVTKI